MSIHLLPTCLLVQIFSSVPFPSRSETSLVCRSWYAICTDPYLYQHLTFEHLELKELVKALAWIDLHVASVSVRSLNIRHCHCAFLDTVVPLPPTFITQLRTLSPKRRRLAYDNAGFHYYDHLSTLLGRILRSDRLDRIELAHCDLDLAMVQVLAGPHLTTWISHDNYTNPTVDLLACVEMRHFKGYSNDPLLKSMAQVWPHLASVVVMGGDVSVSAVGWLVSQCRSLHTLELHDLCIDHLPPNAVRHVTLTNYISRPLSTIQTIHKVFPQLQSFVYESNPLCYQLHHMPLLQPPAHSPFDLRLNCPPTMHQLSLQYTYKVIHTQPHSKH